MLDPAARFTSERNAFTSTSSSCITRSAGATPWPWPVNTAASATTATAISTAFVIAHLSRVLSFDSGADAADNLPGNGADGRGNLANVDALPGLFTLTADDHHFIAR